MPNHVTNKLYIENSGSHTKKEIIQSCLNKEFGFDFNKIIPIDERFQDSEWHSGIISRAKNAVGFKVELPTILSGLEVDNRQKLCFAQFPEGVEKEEINNVIKCLELYRDTGYFCWYDAQRDLWGTKWNAYDCYEPDNKEYIQFNTAWSIPEPVFKALSEKFPDATFKIIFADEDAGSNCGTFLLKNGEIIGENIAPPWKDQSDEDKEKWIKFAYEVKGWDYEEYLKEREDEQSQQIAG